MAAHAIALYVFGKLQPTRNAHSQKPGANGRSSGSPEELTFE